MSRFAFAFAALALSLTAAPAFAANPIQQPPIVFKATKTPLFLGPTPQCPALRFEFQLSSTGGAVLGSGRFCFQSYDFSCDPPPCHDSADVTVAFNLPGGRIEGAGSFSDVYNPDGSATQTGSAVVTRATGVYLGLNGTISWSGQIVFDPDGVPHPDVTYTIQRA